MPAVAYAPRLSMRERAERLSAHTDVASSQSAAVTTPTIEITIPVLNEQRVLEASVRWLHTYLLARFPFSSHVTIADNGSTDGTPEIAARLEHELDEVSWLRLEQKGRGGALRTAWSSSDADVLCHLAVDLSTDLNTLLPLITPLVSGQSDVARAPTFTAIRRDAAEALLPAVADNGWFFDIELLLLAEDLGLRIHHVTDSVQAAS